MRQLRLIAAWVLFFAALWSALSFATYDTLPPELQAGRLTNLGGPLGELFSHAVVRSLGVGAFAFSFYCVLIGYLLLSGRDARVHPLRMIGLVAFMFTFGAFWQALLPTREFPGGAAPLGGILGFEIVTRLESQFGHTWTVITLGVGAVAALLLAADRMLAEIFVGKPSKGRGASKSKLPADLRIVTFLKERFQAIFGAESPNDTNAASLEIGAVGSGAASEALVPKTRKKRGATDEPGAEDSDDIAASLDKALVLPASTKKPRRKSPHATDASEDEAFEAAFDEDAEFAEPTDLEIEASLDSEQGDDGDEEAALAAEAKANEVPAQKVPPKIRDAAAPVNADGVQVIRLSPDPKIRGKEKYELPPIALLQEPVYLEERESDEEIQAKAAAIEVALRDFGVEAKVEEIERGPVITRFDISIARGTKITKVTSLADELAMALGVGRVRIAPVKGRPVLGVEIPNRERETVYLKELVLAADLRKGKIAIPLFLGKDASGHPICEDLATTPHLLIAGRTGAGKSVFVNNLVLSILLTRYPEEVRLIMIDPKKVELEVYQDIPHLLTKVESNAKKATKILEWAVNHMEERYELLAATGVRHLTSYNKLSKLERLEKLSKVYSTEEAEKQPEHLPYIVIIVDELADLMMVSGKEVEQAIARLAQKARAVGIHVVLATQRPSTDVITGLIKSNLPARIAFQTRVGVDSRTIIDRYGAEKLLDKGDMLYLSATSDDPRRVQGPYVSDSEVEKIVTYLKSTASPQYTQNLEQVGTPDATAGDGSERDELFDQAVELVLTSGQASASYLQTRMQVGYARARRLIDLMGEAGIVSEHRGSKARELLLTPEQWEELKLKRTAEASSS